MADVNVVLNSINEPAWGLAVPHATNAASIAIVSFTICLCCVLPIAIKLAEVIGLLDKPDERKSHSHITPAVGGISILVTVIGVSFLFGHEWVNWSMMLWLVIVLAIGVADDRVELSASLRLLLYAFIVVGIATTDGYVVSQLGFTFGTGAPVVLSPLVALAFTVFAVSGAVSVVNMMDGLDGLLGTLIILSLSALLLISITQPDNSGLSRIFSNRDIACLLGALSAFVLLNVRIRRSHARVFLGDAGSLVLGFVVVYLLIDYSQSSQPLISPVNALWILGLPLVDGIAVILTRLKNKSSPMNGGRDHMHHLLVDQGLSVNQTVSLMTTVHLILVTIGVIAALLPGEKIDLLLLILFVLAIINRTRFIDIVSSHLARWDSVNPGISSRTDSL